MIKESVVEEGRQGALGTYTSKLDLGRKKLGMSDSTEEGGKAGGINARAIAVIKNLQHGTVPRHLLQQATGCEKTRVARGPFFLAISSSVCHISVAYSVLVFGPF